MVLHISDEDGIRILKELADERPDYVYDYENERGDRACLYRLPSGEPGCIVGHLIERVQPGVLEELFGDTRAYDDNELPTANNRPISRLSGLSYSDRLGRMLSRAQARQDCGDPWGEAVAEALDSA